ncbi:FAD-dependent oxidoreductase [Amycolatopsis sp. NBC_00438]|uniref:FAD/NAD(P)-dependent oxidoreductase n=1 Tax=Amycolatopsis sp. NBC_00438 TaxID=2903558 RepID=UPI003FA44550
MTRHVVVIGAGPAGLAAAEHALRAGAEVTVLDQADAPGGQYHRMLPEAYEARNPERIHHGWADFARLRRVLEHPRCTWWPNSTVWALDHSDAGTFAAGRPGVECLAGGRPGVDSAGADHVDVGPVVADRSGVDRVAADRPAAGSPAADGSSADCLAADGLAVDRSGTDHSGAGTFAADRPSVDCLAADRSAADRLAVDRPGAGRPAADRPAADRSAADRSGVDRLAGDRPGAGRPAADRSAADRSAADRSAADRSAADRSGVDRLAGDRLAGDRPGAGRPAADRPAAGRPAAGRPGADRFAADRSGVDRLAADRSAADRVAADRPGADLAAADRAPRVHVLRGPVDGSGRERHVLTPDALVLATGAHDRTLPFPGWHLPGVFTAGAAQALAKGERVAIGRRVLVAGSGPFLLPVAESLLGVGAEVVAILEANPPATVRNGWSRRPWRLARHLTKAAELLRYAAALARHRVPYCTGRAVIEARGDDRVREVVTARLNPDWSVIPGTERSYPVDAVCVGHGFVPQLELAVAAGCLLDDGFVRVDQQQRTTAAGVFAAGEITGIGGAIAAAAEGAVAGRLAAGGEPDRGLRRARDRTREFAERLAEAHPVGAAWSGWLRPGTIVCRCEETTVADLQRAASDPVQAGSRALKLGTRAGLGPCQGRMCGPAVAELCGGTERHHRPIAQPIRLGELAEPEPEPEPEPEESHEHP